MTRIDITMQFDSITMKYAGGAITRDSLLRISARELSRTRKGRE